MTEVTSDQLDSFVDQLEAAGHDAPPIADGRVEAELVELETAGDAIRRIVAATRSGSVIDVAAYPPPTTADELSTAIAVGRRLDESSSTRWWARPATDRTDRIASAAGLERTRDLLQLRIPLPLPSDDAPGIPTRPFRPGVDDAAWIAVNNRAFEWHPEQGGMTHERLSDLVAEPWFDPDRFLLHDDPETGELDGFCWAKLHHDTDPVLGEIFVIGVDPGAHRRGLGRALTEAGLRRLAADGAPIGMLYVESDNLAARTTYERIGFTIHHVDAAYTGQVP